MRPTGREEQAKVRQRAEVVCFGAITPTTLLVIDDYPVANTGVIWKYLTEYVSDDAPIVAMLLKRWGIQTGLISTTLGDDPYGRRAAQELAQMGILGEFRLSPSVRTPRELAISDRTGGRTYIWRRDPEVLATLDEADLSLIEGARTLYLDWYDGDHVLRAMRKAKQWDVPVFFNFEHGHDDGALLARYAPYITVCQAITDEAQHGDNMLEVASKLMDSGVPTALVTAADRGCLGATTEELVRVHAPRVDVVDGLAAGATFSAGYQYGMLKGWNLEDRLRFAVAAASLSCTAVGPTAFPPDEILSLARSLEVETGSGPHEGRVGDTC